MATPTLGDGVSPVEICKMLLTGFNVDENASNAFLDQAFGTLNASHPGLRGILTRSINWDNFRNAHGFTIANRAYLNTLP